MLIFIFWLLICAHYFTHLLHMKRLMIDPNQSIENNKNIHNSLPHNNNKANNLPPLKISVVSTHNLDQFLNNRESNRAEKENDTDDDKSSQRTVSIDKKKAPPKIQKTIQLPQQISTILQKQTPATPQIKSPQASRQQFKQKIKSARSRLARFRQQRDFTQIYIIDKRLTTEQKEITINDTKIYFPYEPYTVQVEYMRNVIQAIQNKTNAVLESPTGTGKTLCLLASVLSYVEKQFRTEKIKHNVIYMSRTHSQLRQVQKELSKTCYRPNMAIFASRDQLCLKDNLAMLKGKEKIQACGKGVKLAKKIKKEDVHEQDPKVLQAACFFHKERQEVMAIGKRRLANTLLDIDIMKEIGREQTFCPYFYPMQSKDFTTLFIMPYNYLLDAYLLNNYQEIIENSIIIFDQAHNVSEAACEGRSLMLETHNFDSALLELNKLLSKFLSPSLQRVRGMFEKQIKCLVKMVEDWKQSFHGFIQELYSKEERRESGREESQAKVINKQKTDQALFELFCGKIADQRKRQFSERKDYYRSVMISKLIGPIEEFTSYGVALIEELKETPDGVFSNFERVLIFSLKVKTLLAPKVYKNNQRPWMEDQFNHFRLYTSRNSSTVSNGTAVGLRCLVPWLTFKDIMKYKPRSILLTSGTLKPLPMWQKELKIKFPNQLLNKHVINNQQISAKVIRSGVSTTKFTFTYQNLNKNRNAIFKDLIQFLIQTCAIIPNGVLLVFPSFKTQMDFKYELMRSSKKQKLASTKDIIFEERSSDINMNDFKKKALSKKGAILAIICRGKVSQGIDFPDGMCRAVILVGVPYPNIRDPFIIEKKIHLENIASRCTNKGEVISGEEWYLMGTVRAINQALGRVIRHAMDYGMIFLLDTRYCETKMRKQLPEWISQSMELVQNMSQEVLSQIQEFYSRMKENYKPLVSSAEKSSQQSNQEITKPNALQMLMNNQKKKRNARNGSARNRRNIPSQSFDF